MVIGFLDTLEEFRDLSLEEWNFRQIVQDKWTTLGDDNTKFFYAKATVSHTRNCIRSLISCQRILCSLGSIDKLSTHPPPTQPMPKASRSTSCCTDNESNSLILIRYAPSKVVVVAKA
jgi:hypothetical protein